MMTAKYEKPVIRAKGLSRIYSLGDTSVIGIYRSDLSGNHGSAFNRTACSSTWDYHNTYGPGFRAIPTAQHPAQAGSPLHYD